MCKISSGFKISCFPNRNHILTNSDKFLIFEEIEYIIHHVEMWPALCKFPILISAMKLKHNISQVINIFKIRTSKFFFPIHKEKENWDFWMLLQLELLIFRNSWKNFQVFSSSLNVWEIMIFFLAFIFCQVVRIVFQTGYMCWVEEAIVIM